MILAIDIGNTSITFGLMEDQKVFEKLSIRSGLSKKILNEELKNILQSIQRKKLIIEKAFICSVVPSLNDVLKRKIKTILRLDTFVIGEDIKIPVKNKYDNPSQVGMDRLVGAFAAKTFFGHPVIIIDFGTAITIDVVNQRGEYEGGIIIPGIRLSVESLFLKTAMLPHIESIRPPKNMVGKNTEESILSGIFFGYGLMCSGLINSLKGKKYLKDAKVVLTGGYTGIMKDYIITKIDRIEPSLVLIGISLLNRLN